MFGYDTTRDRGRTTCTEKCARCREQLQSTNCTKIWLRSIVPDSARSRFAKAFSVSTCTNGHYRLSEWWKSRRRRMSSDLTSSSYWKRNCDSPSHIVTRNRVPCSVVRDPLPSDLALFRCGGLFDRPSACHIVQSHLSQYILYLSSRLEFRSRVSLFPSGVTLQYVLDLRACLHPWNCPPRAKLTSSMRLTKNPL